MDKKFQKIRARDTNKNKKDGESFNFLKNFNDINYSMIDLKIFSYNERKKCYIGEKMINIKGYIIIL